MSEKKITGAAHYNGVTYLLDDYAVTGRRQKGEIAITYKSITNQNQKPLRVPFLRGFTYLCNDEKLNPVIGAILLYIAICYIIKCWFVMLPLFVCAFLIFRCTPCAKYHSAEHMVINAYESNVEMNIENVQAQARIHVRCGSNYLSVILIHILMAVAFSAIISSFCNESTAQAVLIWIYPAFVLSVGTEVYICRNTRMGKLFAPIYKLCDGIQYCLATRKPETQQIELAVETLSKLLVLTSTDEKPTDTIYDCP